MCILPRSNTKLKPSLFKDRFVKDPRKHLRAFGSEMFSAASKLALFVALVVDPMHVLPEHSALLKLARKMLELLLLGDRVLGLLNVLDTTIRDHHVLYLSASTLHEAKGPLQQAPCGTNEEA